MSTIELNEAPESLLLRLLRFAPSWSTITALAIPSALLAVATFLRTYRLEAVGWNPDTYERITTTKRLLAGEFPLSELYPPGVAVILAPAFAVFPQTLSTLQAVVTFFGVGLVALAYFGMRAATGERVAPVLFAVAIAASPRFVYTSRDALFDTIVAFIVVACLLLVPKLRGQSLFVFIGYGVVLAILFNIRQTNVAIVPALLFLWLEPAGERLSLRFVLRQLVSPQAITCGLTIVVLMALSMAVGGWSSQSTQSAITTDSYLSNVVSYWEVITYGPGGYFFVMPLAIAGTFRLWRINRWLLCSIGLILFAWPLVHAPFHWFAPRYMLPGTFFTFFLAALGVVELWRIAGQRRLQYGLPIWGITILFASILSIHFVVGSNTLLNTRLSARSDEGLAREIEPFIADFDGDTLIVTTVARALQGKNEHVEYLDLVDHTFDHHGTTPVGVENMSSQIGAALRQGRTVYYLYTHWEAGADFQGNGREGYLRYFNEVVVTFLTKEVFRTDDLRLDKYPWILFRVEERPPYAP